jgi:hypothetical protein
MPSYDVHVDHTTRSVRLTVDGVQVAFSFTAFRGLINGGLNQAIAEVSRIENMTPDTGIPARAVYDQILNGLDTMFDYGSERDQQVGGYNIYQAADVIFAQVKQVVPLYSPRQLSYRDVD